ncbi:MAG TPA: hypothetical protein DCZ92_14940 [Elusimicrobia bacterium]|nr:MAG: hypothetical protein A2016_03675 [Elusimicrobia bacterium GWF2_62_30]HBA62079.1 hypothetical protein [Elusimicrobiota bacterium]
MKLFDAHVHLQSYGSDAELDAAVRAARESGVERLICCGTRPADWERVLEITAKYPEVFPCFGLHPWYAAEAADGWLEKLEGYLKRVPSFVGEIGLDGIKEAPGQEEVFRRQLELAVKLGRPAVIHSVKSWRDTRKIIEKAAPPAFMLHGYGGAAELVKNFANLGAYFSFGGGIMDPKREKLRAGLAAVPPERLLFETEAPERSAPGPAGLGAVLEAASKVLNRPAADLAALSFANAEKLCKLAS